MSEEIIHLQVGMFRAACGMKIEDVTDITDTRRKLHWTPPILTFTNDIQRVTCQACIAAMNETA